MRPPSEPQSALRAPLNEILGTETNVRILRVLVSSHAAMGNAEVARRAKLNPSGVRRSIAQLMARGVLVSVGTGSRRLVRLRTEHPLAVPLSALFEAEAERFDAIVGGLRAAVRRLHPPPRAAWIQGPVATGADSSSDPIIVGILSSANEVEAATEHIRSDADALQARHDVMITVTGWTAADLGALADDERQQLGSVIPLSGPPPKAFMPARRSRETAVTGGRTYQDLDRRALALAQAIADRLEEDPSLVHRAEQSIARRVDEASPGERNELLEWAQLLRTLSLWRLRSFLVDPGERATRLRQTLPFLDALSEEERRAILEKASP